MALRALSWHPSYSVVPTSASVAYLSGLCFPSEREATKNASAPGFIAQNAGVIYRANGLRVGVESAGGRRVGS